MARNFIAGDYLEVPSNAVFDGSLGTLSFWCKHTSTTANVEVLGRHSASSRQGCGIIFNNPSTGQVSFYAYETTSQRVAIASVVTNMNNGAWRHIAAAFDRTTTANGNRVYVDGALEVQAASSGAWAFGANVVRVGKSIDSFWGSFAGDIADVCWWSAQLTANEIAALAKGVSPRRVRPGALELFLPCSGHR